MSCQIYKARLDDYCEDRLDEAARCEFRRHLTTCADCRATAIEQDPTLMFASMPQLEPAGEEVDACVHAVQAMIRNDRLNRRLLAPKRRWFAAAAVALVALAAAVLWRSPVFGPAGGPVAPASGAAVAAATEPAPPPQVEVEMNQENLRVYQFSDAGDENTAVYFIVNEAMEL